MSRSRPEKKPSPAAPKPAPDVEALMWAPFFERLMVLMDGSRPRPSVRDVERAFDFWRTLPDRMRRKGWPDGASAAERLNRLGTWQRAAEDILITEAERLGLDSSSIRESGDVCYNLLRRRPLFADKTTPARQVAYWPDCLGSRLTGLSAAEKEAVRAGERAITRLLARVRLEPERAPHTAGKPGDGELRTESKVSPDAVKLARQVRRLYRKGHNRRVFDDQIEKFKSEGTAYLTAKKKADRAERAADKAIVAEHDAVAAGKAKASLTNPSAPRGKGREWGTIQRGNDYIQGWRRPSRYYSEWPDDPSLAWMFAHLGVFHDSCLRAKTPICHPVTKNPTAVWHRGDAGNKALVLAGKRVMPAVRGNIDVLEKLAGYLKLVAEHVESRNRRDAEKAAAGTADDGAPFYKPSYYQQWNIGDELLRRNSTSGKKYTEGKVRRIKKAPAGGTGKRAVYWYSEPDARRRWPDLFKMAEDEQARKASKPPTA